MNINEIYIRDPYILRNDNTYYMYGSRIKAIEDENGLDVYVSEDLINWSKIDNILQAENELSEVETFWAPEVYKYMDKYYMFVTIKSRCDRRGTCICVSDTPDGEFKLHSNGMVTPEEWECLDGTLYIENGKPYMIFCHEWVQATDGEICAIELMQDLKESIGETKKLFNASEAEYIVQYPRNNYVTDGPFLFKEDGVLYMLWSGFVSNHESGYIVSMAYSESGSLFGEWKHFEKPIFADNGGHGMIFEEAKGERKLILHSPNSFLKTSPKIMSFIKKSKGSYELK